MEKEAGLKLPASTGRSFCVSAVSPRSIDQRHQPPDRCLVPARPARRPAFVGRQRRAQLTRRSRPSAAISTAIDGDLPLAQAGGKGAGIGLPVVVRHLGVSALSMRWPPRPRRRLATATVRQDRPACQALRAPRTTAIREPYWGRSSARNHPTCRASSPTVRPHRASGNAECHRYLQAGNALRFRFSALQIPLALGQLGGLVGHGSSF